MSRKATKKKATKKAASRRGASRDALDTYGLDKVCGAIMEGKSLTLIAKEAKSSLTRLLVWIDADAERSARVREARRAMAKVWDEKAEQGITEAADDFELKKAKELAHHYRWRSSKVAPGDYGDRLQHANDPENPMPSSMTVTLEPGEAYRRLLDD